LIRTDAVGGVAAYDKSRLNRDTGAQVALRELCMAHGVGLAADDSPPEHLWTAEGGLIWETSSAADAYMRRKQSEKMRAQAVTAFESGRHRGDDPFGYESGRDAGGHIAQPRRLVVVEEEATVVRRVFALLTHHPFAETGRILNDEGRQRGRPWSKESVKDLWRRRRLYRGYVTRRAGKRKYGDGLVLHVVADERPGTHDPILSEDEYGAAVAAVEARRRQRSAPRRAHTGCTCCAG
jgi:DNA invertase Pin-like site-specific DNA recombinase